MVAPIIDRFASGVAAAIRSAPYLTAFPPSLDRSPWPDTRRFGVASGATDHPRERSAASDEPLVYVTFGSVLGHLPAAPSAYRTVLEAVAGLSTRVLMTVGHATDPASLGPIPENTRVERWVSQEEVLRRARLVVCHGGSGTTFGALAAGVPLVLYPMFADQPQNARAVHAAGAGVVVGGSQPADGGLRTVRPEDAHAMRAAIEEVIDNPAYHRAATRIADEMAAMPTLDEVIAKLL
jgi:MGT family glycosyltransferase